MKTSVKVLFVSFIGLIFFSVFFSYYLANYGGLYDFVYIPYIYWPAVLIYSIFGVGVLIRAKYRFISIILFFILFLALPVGVNLLSARYFNDKKNAEYEIGYAKERAIKNQEYKKQQYDTLRNGKITYIGSDLQYACIRCGYSIIFPADWGFAEETFNESLSLTTANYMQTKDQTVGQNFGINYGIIDPTDSDDLNLLMFGRRTETTVDGLRALITKTPDTDTDENNAITSGKVTVKIINNENYIRISATFSDEQDLDKNLSILLDNFRVIQR